MHSKFVMRIVAVGASAAAVLGGGTFALAAGSPAAASTTYYACVVTHGDHTTFPWRSLWKTSTSPVTCPRGDPSISWNQTGPQGPAGPRGATGPQGPAGAIGATGAQGPKGDTGAAGAQGPKGDTGAAGAQGPKGDTGATGPQGDPGAAGAQGPKGDPGETGAAGPAGPQGPAGTFGTVITRNATDTVPAGDSETILLSCAPGETPISGGVDLGAFIPGVSIQAVRPAPESGTPTNWFISVANDSSTQASLSFDVVCVSAGARSNAAPKSHSAKIVKRTLVKIRKHH